MLRLSLEAELEAARLVAARVGLGVVKPHILHLGNHTTARLWPWPIVARVASGTSFDLSDDSLERELAIAAHLASRGAPSARPSSSVAPGPHREGECALSFWEFVDGRPVSGEEDEHMAAASLSALHHSLADLEADLPSFVTKVESCETILENPREAPRLAEWDRQFLQMVYARLRGELEGVGGSWRPLHGDTHLGNVLMSASGAIWMDLEAVCMGPLEWDVVNLPVTTWSQFGALDEPLLNLFADVRTLCLAVWCWAEFDRSRASKEAALRNLAKLKRKFR